MQETTFKIPEGFELRKTGENEYTMVPIEQPKNDTETKGNPQSVMDRWKEMVANDKQKHETEMLKEVFNKNGYTKGLLNDIEKFNKLGKTVICEPYPFGPSCIDNDELEPVEFTEEELADMKLENERISSDTFESMQNYTYDDYVLMENERRKMMNKYNNGEIKKLNRNEMDLLRFCHNTDMKEFLREEVGKKPIKIEQDENGYIYVDKTE